MTSGGSALRIALGGLCVLLSATAWAADPPGGIRLLPGYKHVPLQGIDSIVGRIEKPGGLQMTYEIGHVPKAGEPTFGGSFTDRPKQLPKARLRWYREQVVGGQPMHVAYAKDRTLHVSFPKLGVNVFAKVNSADDMADALLMLATIPNPKGKPRAKKRAR